MSKELSSHEFYLKHCTINGKLPEYRDRDKHLFEFIDYCNENNLDLAFRGKRTKEGVINTIVGIKKQRNK